MLCPACKSDQVSVVDSRPRYRTTWRRRSCANCGYRFNTCELEEEQYKAFSRLRSAILESEDLEDD